MDTCTRWRARSSSSRGAELSSSNKKNSFGYVAQRVRVTRPHLTPLGGRDRQTSKRIRARPSKRPSETTERGRRLDTAILKLKAKTRAEKNVTRRALVLLYFLNVREGYWAPSINYVTLEGGGGG